MASGNPRRWNYTWEAQSHIPIIKLFLFSPGTNPIIQCKDLQIDLQFEKSLLHVSWTEQTQVQVLVPIPRVLVDLESPVNFGASDDHIEVKIVLLLPVDHPIFSSFISELSTEDDEIGAGHTALDFLQPLSMESDVNSLSSEGEVDFYCRTCSFKLTKRPIKSFVDMPSVNWREVADNWFGACCCSFGGISEKLVAEYVKSYACVEGTCLVTTTSVVLYKDDLSGYSFPDSDQIKRIGEIGLSNASYNFGGNNGTCVSHVNERGPMHDTVRKLFSVQLQQEKYVCEEHKEPKEQDTVNASCTSQELNCTEDVALNVTCCEHNVSELSLKGQEIDSTLDLLTDQRSFLNGYLGSIFMFRSPALSKEVEWIEFKCPQCSSLLGAYPCLNSSEPLDGGIRLLKCYISSSLPVGSSGDLFRKYTLERMFTNLLLESAKDELSFRTMVKDLKSKSLMMQIVLLNPNSWCCSGYCIEGSCELFPKINLKPVIKVLFSHSGHNVESKSRISKEWDTKNQVDEVFMLSHPIEQLIKCLESTRSTFPPSISSSLGFLLSVIQR
ncbi:hypothetical protein Ancab_003238 [Ancistrocladus abbreviatus]